MNFEKICLSGFALFALTVRVATLPHWSTLPRAISPSISFELLGKTTLNSRFEPEFSEELKAYDGQLVNLSGYASPYTDPQDFTKILLSRSPGGCGFCVPPNAGGVILVRRHPGENDLPAGHCLLFEGTLHLTHPETTDPEARYFHFILDGAKAVRR